jgi:hypothetical protein
MSGYVWTPTSAPNVLWSSIASDSTGTNLVACSFFDKIYTSNDSGVSWVGRESNRFWFSVASDSTGTKLVA